MLAIGVFSLSGNAMATTNNNLTKVFQNQTLGVFFHYPANWTVQILPCKGEVICEILLTHSDIERYKINMKDYPCIEGNGICRTQGNIDNTSYQLGLNIPFKFGNMKNESLKDVANQTIHYANRSSYDFILIGSNQIENINGNPAWKIEYIRSLA
jgi:hypothetical protein